MKKRKVLLRLLLAGFVVFCLAVGDNVLAAGNISADGILTSVEDDGTVVIDEKGYEVDLSAQIVDSNGRTVLLDGLLTPVRVYYEYVYTKRGPVIKLIKEYPKVVPK